jgi:hypothetical protein
MAEDNSGGIGVLGVLVGALIVIVVGGGLLYATGVVGSPKATTVNVSVPPAAAPASAPEHRANVPEQRDDHRSDRPSDNHDRR